LGLVASPDVIRGSRHIPRAKPRPATTLLKTRPCNGAAKGRQGREVKPARLLHGNEIKLEHSLTLFECSHYSQLKINKLGVFHMRITAKGYSRDAGTTVFLDHGIESDSHRRLAKTEVIYAKREGDRIAMRAGPVPLKLGGQYWITVEFTDDDIACLFLEAHPEFRSAIDRIYAKREPPEPSKPLRRV
jgi:hypothetical protein